MNKSRNRSTAPDLRVIEFPRAGQSAPCEEEIEARLRQLTILAKDMCEAGYAVLLAEGTAARDAFDELRVKEAALRWIVRVAKRASGPVREKLWADIAGAVTELEQTADSLMHPQGAENRSAIAGETYILDGNGRIWVH